MSLLRLLTTGKSLVGLKDSEIRYRVTRQRFLPRFGPAKNPFCATDRSGPARLDAPMESEGTSVSIREKAAGIGAQTPAHDAAEDLAVAASRPPTAPASSTLRRLTSALRPRAVAFQNWGAGKFSALLSRRGGKPVRVAMLRPTKLPVQGELSLDKIKVMRNDLSDADLEVVPGKSLAAQTGVAPALQGADRAEVGTAWGRLAGRVFRAGKT